jgi:heptaprenyl diphosphate synthase
VQELVSKARLRHGRIHVHSLHTTLGLAVNENEPLLLRDFEAMLNRIAPAEATYLHDDFTNRSGIPEDEPVNGHAHCRNLLLHPSHTALVEGGRLVLGRWQSIFAVELDGPRMREMAVQLEGEFETEATPAAGHTKGGTLDERRLVDLELQRQLMVDVPAVQAPMRRLVEAGGKRLRPLLVLLTSRLGPRHDPLRAAELAASIELIHSATLVHDDYVDDSPRRRGTPTVAAEEGPARAIAVGDYYFAKATRVIAELGEPAVTTTVAEAMEAICRSQLDDLALRGGYPGDYASYLKVVQGKTAALISASCVAGAQLAGAGAEIQERLRRYGELLGVAFQMADDLVDFSRTSGKPLGQDIRERVLSLPLIYASEDREVGAEVQALLAGSLGDREVGRVVELVSQSGALNRVNLEAQQLAEAAVRELDGEAMTAVQRDLAEVALGSVGRDS